MWKLKIYLKPNKITDLFFFFVTCSVWCTSKNCQAFLAQHLCFKALPKITEKIDRCIVGLPQQNLIHPVAFASVFLLVLFFLLPQHVYRVNLMPGICGTAESLVVPQENLVDQYQFYVTYCAFFDPSRVVIKKPCPCVSHLHTALLGFFSNSDTGTQR